MTDATEWADAAKEAGSWVAAATLLKAAEVFDEKLAVIEEGRGAEAVRTRTAAEVQQSIADLSAALSASERRGLMRHLGFADEEPTPPEASELH